MKKGPGIYLLERDPIIRLDLHRLLSFRIKGQNLYFSSFEEVWRQVQKSPPALLLIDFHPENHLTMLDFINRVRVRFSFPILLLSTWAYIDIHPSVQSMEFTEVLKKPFPDWEFVEILDRLGFSYLPTT